jgi:hypothetical protein
MTWPTPLCTRFATITGLNNRLFKQSLVQTISGTTVQLLNKSVCITAGNMPNAKKFKYPIKINELHLTQTTGIGRAVCY